MSAQANARSAEALVRTLVAAGAQEAVISPGSRNTAIIMALHRHATDGRLKLHTVIDERTAGFYALGLARMSGRPAILCCTSGSAGTHYFPAVVEASKSRIPLFVVTADRPAELHECGAPQTMNQQELYGSHVRLFVHLEAPDAQTTDAHLERNLATLTEGAKSAVPGPIHINQAFRKPLWKPDARVDTPPAQVTVPMAPKTIASEEAGAQEENYQRLLVAALASRRGVILWGAGEVGCSGAPYAEVRDSVSRFIASLSSERGWPVVTDATAGIRDNWMTCENHVGSADVVLSSSSFAGAARPDFVLRIGGEPTSRHVSTWVRDYTAGCSYLLDPSGWTRDPHRTATAVIAGSVADNLGRLIADLSESECHTDPSWLSGWKEADSRAKEGMAAACMADTLWAGSIAATVAKSLPPHSLLHLASSLAIRSFASFVPESPTKLTLTSNRGLNGIDGTIATALGESVRWTGGITAALLGDVAFAHDASALALTPRDRPFIAVVVDNSGGGIFDHLPISDAGSIFEEYFITPPDLDIEAIGRAYGLSTRTVSSSRGLRNALKEASTSHGGHLIIAKVDRSTDIRLHEETWANASRLLEGVTP